MSTSDEREKPYLSIFGMYRDDATYLREWIEFHRLVGAERFFLYNNLSTDSHREVLAPYVEDGTVVLRDWDAPFVDDDGNPWGHVAAMNDCLERHRGDSCWMAFLDIDEFLFSPTGRSMTTVLRDFERAPGVCACRIEFGTSGHKRRPEGLVIDNFTRRRPYSPDDLASVKSIVDPSRALRAESAHHFSYSDGFAVDERENELRGPRFRVIPASFELLRVNHYVLKSEQEFRRKLDLWKSAGGERLVHPPRFRWWERKQSTLDEAITSYVPALREAIQAVEERSGPVHTPDR